MNKKANRMLPEKVKKILRNYAYILAYISMVITGIALIFVKNNITYLIGTTLIGSSTIGFIIELFGLKRLFSYFGISYKFLSILDYIKEYELRVIKIILNKFLEDISIIDKIIIKVLGSKTYIAYQINANNYNFHEVLAKIILKINKIKDEFADIELSEVDILIKSIMEIINKKYNYIIVLINKKQIQDEKIENVQLRHLLLTAITNILSMNYGLIFFVDNIDNFFKKVNVYSSNNIIKLELFDKLNNQNKIDNLIKNNFNLLKPESILNLNYLSILAIKLRKSEDIILFTINYNRFNINIGNTLITKLFAYSDKESRLSVLLEPLERPSPWHYNYLFPHTLIDIETPKFR